MASNRIYSISRRCDMPVDGNVNEVSWIKNIQAEFKLKSVIWDYEVSEQGPRGNVIPIEDITTLSIKLAIGDGVGDMPKITYPFEANTTVPVLANGEYSGSRLLLYRPQQAFFENLQIYDALPFQVQIASNDLAAAYYIRWTLTAEIEILGNSIKW